MFLNWDSQKEYIIITKLEENRKEIKKHKANKNPNQKISCYDRTAKTWYEDSDSIDKLE